MTLSEAISNIQYSSFWGIWASLNEEGRFSLDSEARYGQRCFENGGLLDDFLYFAHGEHIQDFLSVWDDSDIEELIDAINASIEE